MTTEVKDTMTQEKQTEQVQLTIADLQVIGSIIDLASRRGAFQAAELSQVGTTYDKLTKFLTFVKESQEKETGEAKAE
jgi:hypothetical protein